jgi:hypothetical protein
MPWSISRSPPSDRDPSGLYRINVPARRTKHLRFNELDDPERIPRDADYATVIDRIDP